MTTLEVGDEAYLLYCKSRYGDLEALVEFENNTAEAADAEDQLIWQGYHANALYYSQRCCSSAKPNVILAKEICDSLFPALKACLDGGGTNNPHLQYILGWCYHNSLGVTKDIGEVLRFFHLAADQGLAIAQSNLGICYDDGEGVPQDRVQGAKLYRLGANKGHAPAQYNLGLSFYYGNGVVQNYAEAVVLFRQAADQGFSPAQCMLAECYDTGRGVEGDETQAIHWFDRAATQGYAEAQLALAQFYEYGEGVSLDLIESARLTGLAAEQELPLAQYALGIFYTQGRGVILDEEEAVKLFRLAAAQGLSHAVFKLGCCYECGMGVPVDPISAVKWYIKAMSMKHPKAEESLMAISSAYREAIWNNRKGFLLFLAQFQFIYREPRGQPETPLYPHMAIDPDVVHTVFHTEDMRREIMSFL